MDILSLIVNGLNQSAILLIAALGLIVIYGYMNVINMAHGSMIMVGAFVGFVLIDSFNFNFGFALISVFVICALLGIVLEKVIIKKLYSKPTETILATYAISLIFVEIARMNYPISQSMPMPIQGYIEIGNVIIPRYNIFVISFAIFLVVLSLFLFNKTTFGKKLRAINQNRAMAECLGINTASVDTITFAYGSGLAGIAGCVIAPSTGVYYDMGASYLTESFMTVVVGGLQSFIGVVLSSTIIAQGKILLASQSSETWAKIIVFLIIIVIIRIKPEGLFTKERR